MDGLGPKIKQLRLETGMSKAALARRVGVSDVTISYWESGTIKQIGHERLLALSTALGCSLRQLLDDDSLNAMAASGAADISPIHALETCAIPVWEQPAMGISEPHTLSAIQMVTRGCYLVTPGEGERFDFLFEGDLAAVFPCEQFQQDGLYLIEHEGKLKIQYIERLTAGRIRVSGEQLEGASVENLRNPPFRIAGYVRVRWSRQ